MPLPEPVAILGGTFDPVHYGHLRFADDVRRALYLAEVRLVPAADPPHRQGPAASADHREAMLKLAVAEFPGLVVDDRELRRSGKSYTVPTLEELRREFPGRPLWLLLGADAFRELPTWHRWEELFDLANMIVVERPWLDLAASLPPALLAHWRSRRVTQPELLRSQQAGAIFTQAIVPHDVSATAIRKTLAGGPSSTQELEGLLPPAVLAYIARNQLYRPPTDAP